MNDDAVYCGGNGLKEDWEFAYDPGYSGSGKTVCYRVEKADVSYDGVTNDYRCRREEGLWMRFLSSITMR